MPHRFVLCVALSALPVVLLAGCGGGGVTADDFIDPAPPSSIVVNKVVPYAVVVHLRNQKDYESTWWMFADHKKLEIEASAIWLGSIEWWATNVQGVMTHAGTVVGVENETATITID